MHTPQNWQIASKRKEVYQWARFYYENEPKAAAGIDFYAGFPMNGLSLECKDKKILAYYEHTIEKINLEYWLRKISHEYFLLGDAFVFTEIACPVCNGVGHLSNGNICNHPDGTIKRLLVLNPDFIEVQSTQLADEPSVALIPDDDLKRVCQQKKPKQVYDRIPENIKEFISANQIASVCFIDENKLPYCINCFFAIDGERNLIILEKPSKPFITVQSKT